MQAVVTPAGAGQGQADAAGQLPHVSGISTGTAAGRAAFTGFTTGRGGGITVSKAATDRMSKLFAAEPDLLADWARPHVAAEALPPTIAQSRSFRTPVQRTGAGEHVQSAMVEKQQAENSKVSLRDREATSNHKGGLSTYSCRAFA